MARVARRIQWDRQSRAARAEPEATPVELGLRSRSARKIRTNLRRMEPVVAIMPRWGATAQFLQDISLDLAVGEPAIGCRSLSFRSLHGRSLAEAWQATLHAFGQLTQRHRRAGPLQTVADDRGFRWALEQIVEEAHRNSRHRLALLLYDAEHLPVDILEDVTRVWESYAERHPEGRRCTLLLAGPPTARWLSMGGCPRIEVADYAEVEAQAALMGRAGPMPLRLVEQVARFSGGIPGLVEELGRRARIDGQLPARRQDLVAALGSLADEMRGAVDIVAAHDHLSDRLQLLLAGEALEERPEVDNALVLAGLARRLQRPGGPVVQLRAPAIAALVG
jgi:hypothetical protein